MGTIVLFWIVLSVLTAVAASSCGRSSIGWFLLACIISPVFALLLLIALPVRSVGASTGLSWMDRYEGRGDKACPYCRSVVHREATVCPACIREIDTIEAIHAREVADAGRRRLSSYAGASIIAVCLLLGLYFSNVETPKDNPGTATMSDVTFAYTCRGGGGSSQVKVDEVKNTLEWRGDVYKIKHIENCGKYGWRAGNAGRASFDFCTATQGVAFFEKNGVNYECDLNRLPNQDDDEDEPKGD